MAGKGRGRAREGRGSVEGESRAEQGEGGGHSCAVYQRPPAHTVPAPISPISTRHFCLGWPPSPPLPLSPHCQLLFLASSSFLPLIGQKKGTGSSCLAQQPPYPIGWTGGRGVVESPGFADRPAGFLPPPPGLWSLRVGDLSKLCGLSNPSISLSAQQG